MSDLLAAWGGWIAAVTWQSGLVAAGVLAADRLLPRNAWPQLRYGLWWLVAVKLVMPPGLPSPWRAVAATGGGGAAATSVRTAAEGGTTAAAGLPGPAGWAELAAALEGGTGDALLAAAFVVWAAVAAGLAWRAMARRRRLGRRLQSLTLPASRRCRRLARRATDRLGGVPSHRLRTLPAAAAGLPETLPRAPFLTGLWRPTVVLPPAAAGWPDGDLEHVLLHELAHLRRRDLWREALLGALCVVFWFLPWAHATRRRVHRLGEILCDATAARAARYRHRHGGAGAATTDRRRDPSAAYAATLLRLGTVSLGVGPGDAGSAAFGAHRHHLLERPDALEAGSFAAPRRRAATTAAVVVALGVAALPLAAPAPDDQDRAGDAHAGPLAGSARAATVATPSSAEGRSGSRAAAERRPPDAARHPASVQATGPVPLPRTTAAADPAEADEPAPSRLGPGPGPGPGPGTRLADARSAFAATAGDPRAGSLHKRYAALRLLAAESAGESPTNPGGG